ncbi:MULTISPECIES: phage baseplate assembly protein V [Pontibacillus]|uniref:Phage baseplate assembly protein V n=1 Tax=Pontibacillus chungwhensis TaxID=265426 RepID=A0ABY8V4H8_9BACI|nr:MULTISPECIES: phage baseplate assembly protein V [Pontibacillus]MCD5324782.1 phage baseplate assembly protein V [Pontibacillus sp. HN14]WIF98741.1 phage baseplate assembly protein V [Pontibacillus chungwhensis]
MYQFQSASAQTAEILRVGVVASVDATKGTVRVRFEDREDVTSHNLKVIVPQTMKTKYYRMPDIDETVLCCFLQNGIETGYVIGSPYSEVDSPPVSDADLKGVWYEDGTYIEYNAESSTLTIQASNPINLNGAVRLDGDIEVTGNIKVNGNIDLAKDLLIGGDVINK